MKRKMNDNLDGSMCHCIWWSRHAIASHNLFWPYRSTNWWGWVGELVFSTSLSRFEVLLLQGDLTFWGIDSLLQLVPFILAMDGSSSCSWRWVTCWTLTDFLRLIHLLSTRWGQWVPDHFKYNVFLFIVALPVANLFLASRYDWTFLSAFNPKWNTIKHMTSVSSGFSQSQAQVREALC